MDSLAGHLEPGECEISSVSDVVCAGAGSDDGIQTIQDTARAGLAGLLALHTSLRWLAVTGGGLCLPLSVRWPSRVALDCAV